MVTGRMGAGKVRIEIAPDLPVLYADRQRIREAVENLLDNAGKYMGSQSAPRIEIGCRQDGDEDIFFIRDNGIGIDSAYQEKIFGLFEKLDPSVEGTGVGLAIVKRIFEIHGGRIWVESEGAGCGSTFCFTLPRAVDAGTGEVARNER
jgi:signal transduction histidine kinase